jgi:hypothetical protein
LEKGWAALTMLTFGFYKLFDENLFLLNKREIKTKKIIRVKIEFHVADFMV